MIRIVAGTLLLIAAAICLAHDAASLPARVREQERRSEVDDWADHALGIHAEHACGLAGWIAGMTCLICGLAVLS